MIKKTKPISINILSVFIILVCLLLSCVGVTNAWFTSDKLNGVEIVVEIGSLKLSLYQNIDGVNTKILTDQDENSGTTPTSQFIVLEDGALEPDKENTLILTLANEDTGSASMYVRYRFEVYTRGISADEPISSTIDGFTAQSTSQKGFKLNTTDGYYYYTDTSGQNALFERGSNETIMTSFTIPYTSFINGDGSVKTVNSDTVYIKLIIDASSNANFITQ